MNKKQIAIDQLIRNMWNDGTFANVQSVYQLLDWKWSINDSLRVPSVYDIEKMAKDLLNQLDEPGAASCGGLKAELCVDEEDFEYRLTFELEMANLFGGEVVDNQIIVVDTRGNILETLHSKEKDGKIFVTVDNKNNINKNTNNFMKNVDYGTDEYPLTDEWAKSVMKQRYKGFNCE